MKMENETESKPPKCVATIREVGWSDYVECSKYFSSVVRRSQSTPCLPIAAADAAPAPAPTPPQAARPNLSLSWRLACNPVDSLAQNIYRTQKQGTGFLHCRGCSQALNGIKGGKDRGPRKRLRQRNASANGDLPKIVVVDGNTLRAYWNQKRGDTKADDRSPDKNKSSDDLDKEIPPPKKTVLKIKNPYAVPLCHRPTTIMGTTAGRGKPSLCLLDPSQGLLQKRICKPLQHVARLAQEQHVLSPKYAVPFESLYSNPKKGSLYCGNFYYK